MDRALMTELAGLLDSPNEALNKASPSLQQLVARERNRVTKTARLRGVRVPSATGSPRQQAALQQLVRAAELAQLANAAGWSDTAYSALVGIDIRATRGAHAQLSARAEHIANERTAVLLAFVIHGVTRSTRAVEAVRAKWGTLDTRCATLSENELGPLLQAVGVTENDAAKRLYTRIGSALPHARFQSLLERRIRSAEIAASRLREGPSTAAPALSSLGARYAELEIAELLAPDDWRKSWAEVRRRLEQLAAVHAALVEANALQLALPKIAYTTGDTARLTRQLRAERRVLALTHDDVDRADHLLAEGLRSSAAVVRADGQTLARAGFSQQESDALRRRAQHASIDIVGQWSSLWDILRGGFRDLAVSNLPSHASLAQLPGYDELFGRASECRCSHCRSVISPAAYFVDLMCFIADFSATVFVGPLQNHPLRLRHRRPDLWSMNLGCAATEDLVPYLDIVNPVLEQAVADTSPGADTGASVYETTLPTAATAIAPPYTRWLDETRTVLGHVGLSRVEIARTLGRPLAELAHLRLDLGVHGYRLVTTPAHDAVLTGFFGIPSATLESLDAQTLTTRLELGRSALDELLATRFIASAAPNLRITLTRATPESLQYDSERVHGLTFKALDRLYRFERLRRGTTWSIRELDLVLEALGATALDEASVSRIGRVAHAAHLLRATAEDMCTLIGHIPTRPARGDRPPLMDRLFRDPTGLHPQLPDTNLRIVHTHVATDAPATNELVARLCAATGCSDHELWTLLVALAPTLTGAHPAPFAASIANLTSVVRHAWLARRLGWSIDELAAALSLTPPVESLDDLEALLATHRWLRGVAPSRALAALTHDDPRDLLVALGLSNKAVGAVLELVDTHGEAFGAGPTRARRVLALGEHARTWDNPADAAARVSAFLTASRRDGFDLYDATGLSGLDALAISSLGRAITRTGSPLDDLHTLLDAARIVARVGVDGPTLARAVSTHDDPTRSVAAALWGAFRAHYPDETSWTEAYEPYRDALLGRRRDALVAYLLRHAPTRFPNANALYHHYLLDPLMEGCARTSRVAAGIGSLQLYVQRVRLDLERSSDGTARIPPSAVNHAEWQWRRHYRVWEANRKVFLWPENWLDPALRVSKSPLFEALERELTAGPLDAPSLTAAFSTYLRGFDDLASLRIAGAHCDVPRDTLHLVGSTGGDAPRYFHRSVELARRGAAPDGERATRWGFWQPIDLQLPGGRVSPLLVAGRLHLFWSNTTTTPVTRFVGGNALHTGYRHTLSVRVSQRRADDSWAPPQRLTLPDVYNLGAGVLLDRLDPNQKPQLDDRAHQEPIEGYGPSTFDWFAPLPWTDGRHLALRHLGFMHSPARVEQSTWRVAAPNDAAIPHQPWPGQRFISSHVLTDTCIVFAAPPQPGGTPAEPLTRATLLSEMPRLLALGARVPQPLLDSALSELESGFWAETELHGIVKLPHAREHVVHPISGAPHDVIIDDGEQILYVQEGVRDDGRHQLRRLDTSLAQTIRERFATQGIEGLLATDFQLQLAESRSAFTVYETTTHDGTKGGELDLRGPFGVYLEELFFHVPWLVARTLNAAGRFEEAQRWYHFIFDPTAGAADPSDRMWRFRGFRGLTPESLRARLTDRAALEAYAQSPFDPHAIAATRPTAYQKAVFMSYVDNLLDWGDALFAQDTRESIGEATLLYVLAQDLLGPRPVELGDCPSTTLTFADIGCPRADGSEFIIHAEERALGLDVIRTPPDRWADALIGSRSERRDRDFQLVIGSRELADEAARFGTNLLGQADLAFCIPRNAHIDAYWDRVEDRLYKIRHCQNLSGTTRQLALFAPPIDPAMLVRARAAGLDLSELIGPGSNAVPLHRFPILLERARSLTALAQSLGAAFRGAIDRRDAEELARLQQVHRSNVLTLTTKAVEQELELARRGVTLATQRVAEAQARLEHYRGLLQRGLNASESTQESSIAAASTLRDVAGGYDLAANIAHLAPQAGAPTAMTYGGREIGAALADFGAMYRTLASFSENRAHRASLAAGFERREESWRHQLDLCNRDLQRATQELSLAELRYERTEHSHVMHRQAIEQHEEGRTLEEGRFSNLARLDTQLGDARLLYRQAFTLALDAAERARRAFTFERGEGAFELTGNYWSAAHAGMLAAERLMLDLARMEERYLATDQRSHEIHQVFSLAQIAPAALLHLKGPDARCQFTLDEMGYDLFYPGHYRRRIKSVRLSIPCVTGAYTNVGATLSLLESRVRPTPGSDLVEVSEQLPTTTIATSTAQVDGGGFELSFRDARYLPFEGASAVGTWSLVLPKSFRPFDYSTINDVLIHVSYTALEDQGLRRTVEDGVGDTLSRLEQHLLTTPATRLLSLRQEFSSAFHRLVQGDRKAVLELGERHFPLYLQGRALKVTELTVLIETSAELPTLSFDGEAPQAQISDAGLAGWRFAPAAVGEIKRAHTIELGPATHVRDVLLRIRYALAET